MERKGVGRKRPSSDILRGQPGTPHHFLDILGKNGARFSDVGLKRFNDRTDLVAEVDFETGSRLDKEGIEKIAKAMAQTHGVNLELKRLGTRGWRGWLYRIRLSAPSTHHSLLESAAESIRDK